MAAGTAGRAAIPFCSSPLGGRPIGRTPDSDSGYPGSSPGLPANLLESTGYLLSKIFPRDLCGFPQDSVIDFEGNMPKIHCGTLPLLLPAGERRDANADADRKGFRPM